MVAALQQLSKIAVPAGSGFVVDGVHLNYPVSAQVGMSGSMKAGLVRGLRVRNSIFSAAPDVAGGPWPAQTDQKWTARLFNLDDAIFEDCEFRNNHKEHFLYLGVNGSVTIRRCSFRDTGSQAIQIAPREADSFEGAAGNKPGLTSITGCQIERCGQPYGTRQSWNISLFGWETAKRDAAGKIIGKGPRVACPQDVEIAGCSIIGYGYPHSASGGRQCDSTGAIFVEKRPRVSIRRSKIAFTRPDRGVIHLLGCGDVEMAGLEVWGGKIVLAEYHGSKIRIAPGKGDAEIHTLEPGTNQTKRVSTLAAGYSQ